VRVLLAKEGEEVGLNLLAARALRFSLGSFGLLPVA
jgi:hypothetical protein